MSISGHFVLSITCDKDDYATQHHQSQSFIGTSRDDCLRQARNWGWITSHYGQEVCPTCIKRAERLELREKEVE